MRVAVLIAGLLVPVGSSWAAPGACFPPEAGLDSFQIQWFCKHLTAAGLAPLAGETAYRFIYLPTFHSPRIVTVEVSPEETVVTGLVLSGQGGYDPGTVAKRTSRALTAAESQRLQARLEEAGIWSPDKPDDRVGMDGAQWILEGRSGGRYRLHNVWSPRTERRFVPYVKACAYLLHLASIQPSGADLY